MRLALVARVVRNSPMDPLSDVLSLLGPRSYEAWGFDAGGDICVRFPEQEGIKCDAVVSGQCAFKRVMGD
jgi:hypothetical protein